MEGRVGSGDRWKHQLPPAGSQAASGGRGEADGCLRVSQEVLRTATGPTDAVEVAGGNSGGGWRCRRLLRGSPELARVAGGVGCRRHRQTVAGADGSRSETKTMMHSDRAITVHLSGGSGFHLRVSGRVWIRLSLDPC